MENQDSKQSKIVEAPKQYVFFHVAGQVTYIDTKTEEGKLPEYKREVVTTLYRGSDTGISGKEYGFIHSHLIRQFQKEYAPILELTKVEPDITKCDILTIVPLGLFTQEEFEAGIELTHMTSDPDKKS